MSYPARQPGLARDKQRRAARGFSLRAHSPPMWVHNRGMTIPSRPPNFTFDLAELKRLTKLQPLPGYKALADYLTKHSDWSAAEVAGIAMDETLTVVNMLLAEA